MLFFNCLIGNFDTFANFLLHYIFVYFVIHMLYVHEINGLIYNSGGWPYKIKSKAWGKDKLGRVFVFYENIVLNIVHY